MHGRAPESQAWVGVDVQRISLRVRFRFVCFSPVVDKRNLK